MSFVSRVGMLMLDYLVQLRITSEVVGIQSAF